MILEAFFIVEALRNTNLKNLRDMCGKMKNTTFEKFCYFVRKLARLRILLRLRKKTKVEVSFQNWEHMHYKEIQSKA